MANPIEFTPKPVNPKLELQRRLDAAPVEHGEALLVAWDIIQKAHDEGLLDLVHGLIGAKDEIFGKISDYARLPEGVAGIRNLMGLGKLLMLLDPDVVLALTQAIESANKKHVDEPRVPGLWTLGKRLVSEDARRTMSFATLLLGEVGKALNTSERTMGRVSPVPYVGDGPPRSDKPSNRQ